MTQLISKTLLQIRDLLAQKEVSATDVVLACTRRIEETKDLNANITVCADAALLQAKALDQQGPDPSKPLWGVPVAVKDCIVTKDIRTTCASRMLENFVPFYDAFVVARLKEAGAIIISKTNMDEFAMGSASESSFFGPTHNPWQKNRIPGGSSGGSAAAVAAGQVYAALATDTGGSVRQPASMCGCVGLKPTYGRLSRYGAIGFASSLDQVGILARSVEDNALMLEVMAGLDRRDSTCSAQPVEAYTKELLSAPPSLKGVRLGLPKQFWAKDGLSDEVLAETEKAIEQAKELGAELVEVDMPNLPYSVATFYIIAPAEASTNLSKFDGVRYGYRSDEAATLEELYEKSRTEGFGNEVKRRIMLGTYVLSSGYYDAYYKKASQVRALIRRDYMNALDKCDMLLAPVSPVTAWKIGEHSDDPLKNYLMDVFTVSLNLAGLPGVALPAGLGAASGLPVGVQLLGRPFAELALLKAAKAMQQGLGSLGLPPL